MPYPDGARLDLPGGPEEPIDIDAENMADALDELTACFDYIKDIGYDKLQVDEWPKLNVLVAMLYTSVGEWRRTIR